MALPFQQLKSDARAVLFLALSLTIIGFIFIYSASSIFALEKFGSAHYFLKKQLMYSVVAALGFFCFTLIPLAWWQRFSGWLFWGAMFLTMLTFLPFFSLKIHGSNRWLSLAGFSFQPSELLKLFLFIYIGAFLEKENHTITSFFRVYVPFLLLLGLTFLVLLKQPDFGSVVTIFVTSFIILFVAHCQMKYLLFTGLLALPAIVFLVLTKAYRLKRILIFLNPWADARGSGFQIIQSLIAIGSGAAWGLGVSESRQKFFYLPMQHTDFIFSIIAEETGFFGCLVLVGLFVALCFYGLRVALALDRPFAFFTTLGFIVFITLQTTINIMVACGLLPTKGLGLPFVSYGGTALICMWCMIGFIINCAREVK